MNCPGIYDDLCTAVRVHAEAQAAVVIVLGGNCGSGGHMRTINQNRFTCGAVY